MASTISGLNLWVYFHTELLYHLKKNALNYDMQLDEGGEEKKGGRQGDSNFRNKKMQSQLDWTHSPKKEADLQEGQDKRPCC